MQNFEEYEKSVPSYVPTGSISWIVNRLHVSVPDSEVEADMRKRLAGNDLATEEMITACVEYALACHHSNQGLYRSVVSGRL
jgi:hypothetical protein